MMTKIKGNFTCDNSYAVYTGDEEKVSNLILQASNTATGQIVKSESIELDISAASYIYLVCWSGDNRQYQGLIASFSGSQTINTGNPAWKVLASNNAKATNIFPSIREINDAISKSSESDWQVPFKGPKNTQAAMPFGVQVENIPEDANWVWYDSGKDNGTKYPQAPYVPFSKFNHDEVLIFKIPAAKLVPELRQNIAQNRNDRNCCPPQPIVVNCCGNDDETPTVPPVVVQEKCCGTCVFEVRFQRWRYVSGSPGFLDGQAELKFTNHFNGNMYNYPATNGSWVALNKRKGRYPKGWRAANVRIGIVEVPCHGKRGVDLMTELTEVAKKEKGLSLEGGEPYGTSEVDTVYFECGLKPRYTRQKVKLEHGGNKSEDLEIEIEYRFSEVTSCSCC